MPENLAVPAEFSARVVEASDLATLRRLVAEMQDFERGIDPRLRPGDVIASEYTAAMIARCEAQDGVILLADFGTETVGFVAVVSAVPPERLDEAPGSHALVTDLGVTPSFRGKGIGRALLHSAEVYVRSRGAKELRIAVLEGNRPATRLYESAGFNPYLMVLAKQLD